MDDQEPADFDAIEVETLWDTAARYFENALICIAFGLMALHGAHWLLT